jgi:hypothetical protein
VYTVFFGFKSLYNIAGDFYLSMYLPVNLAGYYYTDSRYFQIEDKKPFSSNTLSLSTSSTGNFSLQYVRRHVKLEAGVDYSFQTSMLTLNDTRLTNEIKVNNTLYDREDTCIPARSRYDLQSHGIFLGLLRSGLRVFLVRELAVQGQQPECRPCTTRCDADYRQAGVHNKPALPEAHHNSAAILSLYS